MKFFTTATAATAALLLMSSAASAQSNDTQQQPNRQQDRLNSIFGALFGDRNVATGSLDAQWASGRFPLATQRAQFENQLDADVRSGSLNQAVAMRLKSDYYELVMLEARYGADRRFTTQERRDLSDRYAALTQVISDGRYGDGQTSYTATVADGQAEFSRRVDAALSARRLSRTQATRLKSDYSALIQTEANYMRDGMLDEREKADLDARLDALDVRVGDVAFGASQTAATPRTRLDAIARALPSSGLTAAVQAQLRVEHEDLSRLENAYGRFTPSADDRAYLERRLFDLETRARVRR
ncbi:hypothetical protein [Blastomonas sp.]|uniref:hypothetical protein n=1 Tax=Blastomonas sp. TaxID=1909299 RepID=UPI003593957A